MRILSNVDRELLSLQTSAMSHEDVMLAAVLKDAGKLAGLGSSGLSYMASQRTRQGLHPTGHSGAFGQRRYISQGVMPGTQQ